MSGAAVGGLLFTLALAGAMAPWRGAGVGYAFTLAMVTGFIVLVGMIRTPMVQSNKKACSVRTVLAGLEYVWQTKLLLGSISLDLFAVMLGGGVALLRIFATDILHAGPGGLGLLRAMPSVGALAVSLTMLVKPIKRKAGVIMLTCVGIFGAATGVFGLSESLWVGLGALGVVGGSGMGGVVVRSGVLQWCAAPA